MVHGGMNGEMSINSFLDLKVASLTMKYTGTIHGVPSLYLITEGV